MKKETDKSFLAKLLFTISMAIGFIAQSHAAEKQCGPLKRLASLDLAGEPATLVPVQVGSSPAYMILHIGSPFSVVFSNAVDRFKFTRKPFKASAEVSMGGTALTELAEVDGLKIGNMSYEKSSLLIFRHTGPLSTEDNIPVIGSLALDVFATNDFEIDIAHRKLNIYSQDHCAGKVVYWTDAYASAPLLKGLLGTLYFPMELDGKKIEAVIDPQTPTTRLATIVTKRLYDFDERSQGNEAEIGPDGRISYYYRPMRITAPGLRISNTKVELVKESKDCKSITKNRASDAVGYTNCSGAYPLILGYSVLEKLRIYFETKEKMIHYTNSDAGSPTPAKE